MFSERDSFLYKIVCCEWNILADPDTSAHFKINLFMFQTNHNQLRLVISFVFFLRWQLFLFMDSCLKSRDIFIGFDQDSPQKL